ncbi:polyhydroxyalkanoate synthesis regulator DNA-binding domain-containing protein [Desulfonema magnum]|uniref:PHB/PHA accumulation regulator DNA-binding domain-containing protein n=1 Tax=Desulfonema magnum TaxID=45655 RepID=A0A975BQZ1_9BACT|nr:polyhydroxyalkanoate synthesis regulator DNA-binding domain-containing protein [Desulfonema magnum]QTA89778.1 PHB/PHA accumulation regulator DNA-binding domain-containing protein [Desulfonema magnum]
MSHKIKKYANRKFYDSTEKKYVSLDDLSALIKAGEEISIEDNETGEDLTSSVVAQLLAREKQGDSKIPSGVLIDLLRKGGGTVINYARKYTSQCQSALTMAEDEVDKIVSLLVKNKELSESEGSRLKKEMLGRAENFKKWVSDKIDQRINEVMKMTQLATKEDMVSLTAKIEALTETVERLEKLYAEKKDDNLSDQEK